MVGGRVPYKATFRPREGYPIRLIFMKVGRVPYKAIFRPREGYPTMHYTVQSLYGLKFHESVGYSISSILGYR